MRNQYQSSTKLSHDPIIHDQVWSSPFENQQKLPPLDFFYESYCNIANSKIWKCCDFSRICIAIIYKSLINNDANFNPWGFDNFLQGFNAEELTVAFDVY